MVLALNFCGGVGVEKTTPLLESISGSSFMIDSQKGLNHIMDDLMTYFIVLYND